MSLYIVSMSTVQGSNGPTVNMSYHRTEREGQAAYDECLDSVELEVGQFTVIFVRVDEETMKETLLDSFEYPYEG